MHFKTNRRAGFTLVEIMIVVAIIGLLAAIAIPNFMKARTRSQMDACINNLRQIDGAKQQWALESKAPVTATLAADGSDVLPYLGRGSTGVLPLCPASGTVTTFVGCYTIGDVGTGPRCIIDTTTHVLP